MTDILILGGGIIGLATALELRQRGCRVRVVCRDRQEAAGFVAAGMIAPQAEGLSGPQLELGLASRALYPDWIARLEALTGLDCGYWPSGILVPYFEAGEVSHHPDHCDGHRFAAAEARAHQPGLGDVQGAIWYPHEAQVDNRRRLMRALLEANRRLGVELIDGVSVERLLPQGDRLLGVETATGLLQAEHYVLAAGSWSGQLLDLPVRPIKGQMFSVRQPADAPCPLRTVLFGPGTYIVPRRDGLIVVGATAEDIGFRPGNTPTGTSALMAAASRLFPPLANYPVEEIWWGYRPGTPDEGPLLGPSGYGNLTLATGHYRNGILYSPITAQLVSDWILEHRTSPLLEAFHQQRFSGVGANS